MGGVSLGFPHSNSLLLPFQDFAARATLSFDYRKIGSDLSRVSYASAMNRDNFRLLLAVMAFLTLLMVLLSNGSNDFGGYLDPFPSPPPPPTGK